MTEVIFFRMCTKLFDSANEVINAEISCGEVSIE